MPYSSSSWHKYGVIAVANVIYASMQYVHFPFPVPHVLNAHKVNSILNIGWLSVYCKTPQERSVSMAYVLSFHTWIASFLLTLANGD